MELTVCLLKINKLTDLENNMNRAKLNKNLLNIVLPHDRGCIDNQFIIKSRYFQIQIETKLRPDRDQGTRLIKINLQVLNQNYI